MGYRCAAKPSYSLCCSPRPTRRGHSRIPEAPLERVEVRRHCTFASASSAVHESSAESSRTTPPAATSKDCSDSSESPRRLLVLVLLLLLAFRSAPTTGAAPNPSSATPPTIPLPCALLSQLLAEPKIPDQDPSAKTSANGPPSSAFSLLPTAHCLLPTAYCLLPTLLLILVTHSAMVQSCCQPQRKRLFDNPIQLPNNRG
jgi:hypothetical protein